MITLTSSQIENFKKFVQEHDFFLVSGHKEPDGDSLSSCLCVADILEKNNKPYQLLSAGPFKRPEIRKFESMFKKRYQPDFIHSTYKNIGLIIVDCSEKERLGDILTNPDKYDTFIIDHHKTSVSDNEKSIIIPESPATAFILQLLYESIIGNMDSNIANILFFGMCTDTGYFRFLDQNNADFFTATSRLVAAGANPRQTYNEITSGKAFSTRKLLGLMLERAEQKFNGKLIYTWENLEDTQKYGSEGRDSDSLYQLLLSVENVKAVLFIRQDTDKTCTAGFRSIDSIDVSAIAAKFGGGGHKNAAGLSTTGKIHELLPAILDEFSKIL